MGFYPPATLVRDAQRRGVETRPPDVNRSGVGCHIEDRAVRVGLKYVQGVGEDDAEAIVGERDANGPYTSIRALSQRAPISKDELSALVESGACDSFGLKRRELLWQLGLVPRPTMVPPRVYARYRSVIRGEPLLLARGRFEHADRNRNVLVREVVSLGPLARELTDGADVHGSLPSAHHFGHR